MVVFSSLEAGLLEGLVCASRSVVEARALFQREGIPLVLCSTHTRAQVERTQQELGIKHPFVVENGTAAFIPAGYFPNEVAIARDVAGYKAIEFAMAYAQVVDVLDRVARRLRLDIMGFSQMSVQDVAIDCNLSLLEARLAKLREYSEPFRLLNPDDRARRRLAKALNAVNLVCTNHGRYEHASTPVDQGLGVTLLVRLYQQTFGSVFTIGLGASLNDVPLLNRMDMPLVVDGGDPDLTKTLLTQVPRAQLTSTVGVRGWADAVLGVAGAIRQRTSQRPLDRIGFG